MWGATLKAAGCRWSSSISIHAPRVGRDLGGLGDISIERVFQSTRPVWGATLYTFLFFPLVVISIHAPRVGRDNASADEYHQTTISIHAPRVGRDWIFRMSVSM